MISLFINYATPSVFNSTRERALLGLAANGSRPVNFHAKVVGSVLHLRLALQALGELVWSHDRWDAEGDRYFILDPVVTVHPDRVFFEAFSSDQSAYGVVIADRACFEPQQPVQHGTTNVDFTAWLWAALAEMRSSRETFFHVGAEGFEVSTTGAGARFERKVDIPDDWVRGFLQLQGAMALPGTRLRARPVDLLAAIRFLRYTKSKVSPRALRYEFEPGQDAALVLEPWEYSIPLRGAEHAYADRRVIRTWGRRRLALLEPLLPFADSVDVFLKGRALPSFYAVTLPGVTFVLGLSGWTAQRWTSSGSFDLLVNPGASAQCKPQVLSVLKERLAASVQEIASEAAVDVPTASSALMGLCAEGCCIHDLESRQYRHRELFPTPIDTARLYPPDARKEESERLVKQGDVEIAVTTDRETRKLKRFKTPDGPVFREIILRDWVVHARVGDQPEVELVLNDEDRMIFGRCGCAFFQEHILSRGPCSHLLALLTVAQPMRRDAASSTGVDKESFRDAQADQNVPERVDVEDKAEPELDSTEDVDDKP